MHDLISKEAAIDALDEQIKFCDNALCDFNISLKDEYAVKVERASLCAYKEILEDLPPAQPEQSSEIQGILDYLDTVLHPIVSPEHWDVYSELHDMISMLLSAQFEPNCKGCKHQPRFAHEEPCCTCANNYENKYER